jgi:hypothetical protein
MQCRVHVTKAVEDIDDFGNHVKECSALVRATDGDRYCTLYFYEPDKSNLSDSKIWAHCSCPYYTFHVEVVNALKKSSDVINSNGELPVIKNPRMVPHLCKHLIALGKLAIAAKYKGIKRRTIMTQKEEEKVWEPGKGWVVKPQTKVPPSKALRRPGEREPAKKPGTPGAPKGAPPKAGPKAPNKPAARPLAGPKPVKPVAGPRRPR